MKTCSGKNSCGENKELTDFYFNNKKQIFFNLCKKCYSENNIKIREARKSLNPEEFLNHNKELKQKRKQKNLEGFRKKQKEQDKKRRENKKTKDPQALKEYEKQIRENAKNRNPELYFAKKRAYEKKRRDKLKKENPEKLKKIAREASAKLRKNKIFNLKMLISRSIYKKLKEKNKSKNEESCLKYLNYSIEDLKQHLESQFEPWMSWNNHGQYIFSTWDDNDSTTWKWQLDHIIPHSTFNYDSMDHPDFIKCWSLDNLRPYSAKLNVIDGTRKTRHNNL